MPDLSTFSTLSTVAAIGGISIGVLGPAIAMGWSISRAGATAGGRTFHHADPVYRPGDDRVTGDLCPGHRPHRTVSQSTAGKPVALIGRE